MKQNPLVRVAHVKFSPNGKAYPTRCDRADVRIGHEVEVLMRADSDDAYFMDGVVDSISHERWHCTCRVANLVNEVEYSMTDDGMFERRVSLKRAPVIPIEAWRERRNGYRQGLPHAVQDEMRELYEAVAGEDGEDAYLGAGVWIKPDGSIDDRD